MNKLTKPMRHLITNYNVGAVASVNENGLPAVSPKATFVIIDNKRIAFGNIRSPATVANLRARPEVEINFVDVLTRRAVRIKGSAEIVDKDSEAGQQLLPVFEAAWAPYLKLMDSFVSIFITDTELILSPAYDVGHTAEELRQVNLEKLARLAVD